MQLVRSSVVTEMTEIAQNLNDFQYEFKEQVLTSAVFR